jgi:hypothetical protein
MPRKLWKEADRLRGFSLFSISEQMHGCRINWTEFEEILKFWEK